MNRSPKKLRGLWAIGALLSLGLSACATSITSDPEATAQPAATQSAEPGPEPDFPRTIVVPQVQGGATELVIPAAPERIAALSYETAELVAALGAGEKLVAIPRAVQNPVLSNHADIMRQVPYTVPTERETDPEAIIAQRPDLVLLSARHGLNTGAGSLLAQAGIPVLVLPNTWSSVAEMLINIDLVAQALGAEDAGAALQSELSAGLALADNSTDGPRILVLSNQAGRPFITAGPAFPLELVRLAGGVDISAEMGFAITGPITAEHVVEADPDGILLIDLHGTGAEMFAAVMANPAVQALPASKQDRVMLISGKEVQALGLHATIGGKAAIASWIDSWWQ